MRGRRCEHVGGCSACAGGRSQQRQRRQPPDQPAAAAAAAAATPAAAQRPRYLWRPARAHLRHAQLRLQRAGRGRAAGRAAHHGRRQLLQPPRQHVLQLLGAAARPAVDHKHVQAEAVLGVEGVRLADVEPQVALRGGQRSRTDARGGWMCESVAGTRTARRQRNGAGLHAAAGGRLPYSNPTAAEHVQVRMRRGCTPIRPRNRSTAAAAGIAAAAAAAGTRTSDSDRRLSSLGWSMLAMVTS